jgi:fructose-1-phosphate kinase PfkB-like protein
MAEEIVNKVAKSGIQTVEIEKYFPETPCEIIDIAENLWQGIALKEKDFREFVKENDWSKYDGKAVAVHCSVDAIVPTWAYMLLASSLQGHAARVVFGNAETLKTVLIIEKLRSEIDPTNFEDARIVVKGCSEKAVSEAAFVELINILQDKAKMIMYGEPCSTVPVWKRPKK